MLEAFHPSVRGNLQETNVEGSTDLNANIVWVDLITPNADEQQWVLDAYGIELPSIKSLEDISASARCFRDDDGNLHISTYFLSKNRYQPGEEEDTTGRLLITAQTVAFILHAERLFTLRGQNLLAFRAFRARSRRNDYEVDYTDATWVLLGLLEAKLDELADILEDVHKEIERSTTDVLNNHHREYVLDLDDMVTRLAQQDDVLGKAQLCLIDLRRVLVFLSRPRALGSNIYDNDVRELTEDVRSLIEHNAFLFQKVRFLLDTTSGFINTEQSDIIKRFSVISSMLAPPMLVTGFFGMNVLNLPLANTHVGLFFTLSIMFISFLAPYFYFKYKGWL